MSQYEKTVKIYVINHQEEYLLNITNKQTEMLIKLKQQTPNDIQQLISSPNFIKSHIFKYTQYIEEWNQKTFIFPILLNHQSAILYQVSHISMNNLIMLHITSQFITSFEPIKWINAPLLSKIYISNRLPSSLQSFASLNFTELKELTYQTQTQFINQSFLHYFSRFRFYKKDLKQKQTNQINEKSPQIKVKQQKVKQQKVKQQKLKKQKPKIKSTQITVDCGNRYYTATDCVKLVKCQTQLISCEDDWMRLRSQRVLKLLKDRNPNDFR